MNVMAIVWLVLMVAFLIAEASTVSLVSVWFAAGSLVGIVASLLKAPIWLQILLVLAVSGICLALLRPLVKKYFTPHLTATNAEAVVGTVGKVTQDIDNVLAQGRVKLGAVQWTARSSSGTPIAQGQLVKADRIEGVKIFVSPVQNKE